MWSPKNAIMVFQLGATFPPKAQMCSCIILDNVAVGWALAHAVFCTAGVSPAVNSPGLGLTPRVY